MKFPEYSLEWCKNCGDYEACDIFYGNLKCRSCKKIVAMKEYEEVSKILITILERPKIRQAFNDEKRRN